MEPDLVPFASAGRGARKRPLSLVDESRRHLKKRPGRTQPLPNSSQHAVQVGVQAWLLDASGLVPVREGSVLFAVLSSAVKSMYGVWGSEEHCPWKFVSMHAPSAVAQVQVPERGLVYFTAALALMSEHNSQVCRVRVLAPPKC
jgi:hypothetical protein